MTTLNEAREAIYARWAANWSDPYVFDNEQFKESVPWARFIVRNQLRRQITLGAPGDRVFNDRGLIFIQIFEPGDTGTAVGDGLASTARGIFEGVSFSGIRCFASTTIEVGVEGKWFKRHVSTEFDYEETK